MTDTTSLMKHLAMVHYKDEVATMYGPGDGWQCGKCGETSKDEEALVTHLVITHQVLQHLVLKGESQANNVSMS
jgi:hypothetical protein